MTLVSNTFVVTQSRGIAVHLSNADRTAMSVEMDNNLISGGSAYLIDDAASGSVAGTNNWMRTGSDPGTLINTVFGDDDPFRDAAGRDFTLAPDSTAIDGAATEIALAPDREYYQNETVTRMYRPRDTANDIGAFESTNTGSPVGPYD